MSGQFTADQSCHCRFLANGTRAARCPDGIREIEFFANAEDTQLLIEASCEPGTPSTPVQRMGRDCAERLPEIAGIVVFKAKPSSVSEHAEPKQMAASGARELTYQADDASYRVSAGAFFQVNRHLINELVEIVTEGYSGDTALDLYAGVGLFSTILCPKICTGNRS